MKIGLLSDTHSFLDPALMELFADRDELWHGGDFGSQSVIDQLQASGKPIRGVYGNIDDKNIQHLYPLNQVWTVQGLSILMTHIAGYPGKYSTRVKKMIVEHSIGLLICGHSHILKIMKDPTYGLLHLNPGACGHEGFHTTRTALRFDIHQGKVDHLEIIELGARGKISL